MGITRREIGAGRLRTLFNPSATCDMLPSLTVVVQRTRTFSDRITVSNEDAIPFVERQFTIDNTLCYLDPPYYLKGSKLYRNYYEHADHCAIRELLAGHRTAKRVLSYDGVPEVRQIYAGFEPISYSLRYSAGSKATGREVIYFSDALAPPDLPGFQSAAA